MHTDAHECRPPSRIQESGIRFRLACTGWPASLHSVVSMGREPRPADQSLRTGQGSDVLREFRSAWDAVLDGRIDWLVYELDGLTEAEIKIVEEGASR